MPARPERFSEKLLVLLLSSPEAITHGGLYVLMVPTLDHKIADSCRYRTISLLHIRGKHRLESGYFSESVLLSYAAAAWWNIASHLCLSSRVQDESNKDEVTNRLS